MLELDSEGSYGRTVVRRLTAFLIWSMLPAVTGLANTPSAEFERGSGGRGLATLRSQAELDAIRRVLKLAEIAPTPFATDQGRLYLALGAPSKVMRYSSGELFRPLEVWQYRAIPKLNIRHSVEFLFFKDESTGKYKMYSPSLDAIDRLLR